MQLHEKGTIKNQFYYGVNSTLTTYLRDDVLAQINFKVRELELLANGMLDYTGTLADYESSLKEEINTLITELNEILFGISEGRQIIAEINEDIVVPSEFNIKSMLKDSTIMSLHLTFTQAFFDVTKTPSFPLLKSLFCSLFSIQDSSLRLTSQNSTISPTYYTFIFSRQMAYKASEKVLRRSTRFSCHFTRNVQTLLVDFSLSQCLLEFSFFRLLWFSLSPRSLL